MASDGRDRISDLYHRALQRPHEERGAFLEEACGGDAAMRDALESLLGYEADAARFLETQRREPTSVVHTFARSFE